VDKPFKDGSKDCYPSFEATPSIFCSRTARFTVGCFELDAERSESLTQEFWISPRTALLTS